MEFSFAQDKPRSSIIIFDITLGLELPSMRQQWDILSTIFTEIKKKQVYFLFLFLFFIFYFFIFYSGCLNLCTPTLFTVQSSSSTSSERLDTVEYFPSIKNFGHFFCLGTTTMSRRVASTLILAN
jgi:hypothetical protein